MENNQCIGNKKIHVISYGLGPIGMKAARIVLDSPRLKMVGAVDIAPEKIGKDIGDLLGLNKRTGILISNDASKVFGSKHADVVLHATGSKIKKVYSQVQDIVSTGMNCVSSCEELFFPYSQNSHLSEQINTLAKEHNVTVLGTGVNPGFVMDTLPLFLTGVCQEVKSVQVERVLDASTRRLPLQKKIGATLSPELFRDKVKEGLLGHIGLTGTMKFIAHNLGWNLDKVQETIEPVVADENLSTQYLNIRKNCVTGINHTVYGIKNGKKLISLNLQMYVGAKNPHDLIRIKGNPDLEVHIKGGIPGDIATAAILVNAIPLILQAEPGLITMKDLPLLHIIEEDSV